MNSSATSSTELDAVLVKPLDEVAPSKASPSATPIRREVSDGRFDPIRGQWTIVAGGRGDRPVEIAGVGEQVRSNLACPFCGGNESLTPPAVYVDQKDEIGEGPSLDTRPASWNVRVVPNKFPAVSTIDESSTEERHGVPMSSRRDLRSGSQSLLRHQPVSGAHEVIVESPRHLRSLSELTIDEVQAVFQSYAKRIRHWNQFDEVEHISVFKNVGSDAGASLCHSHSQLIATDIIPDDVHGCYRRMQKHKVTTGCCLQCDLIREETKKRERVVSIQDGLIAFCPFASHLPMMLRITTIDHQRCFSDLAEAKINQVAKLMHRAVGWLEQAMGSVAYNFVMHCHPNGIDDSVEAGHWSIDLFPRMTKIAGFEWNTGTMINSVPPESAAATYRRHAKAESPRRWLST